MARRVIEVKIEAAGRDHGKIFVITEMSALKAEKWGARALNAMSKSLGGFPDELMSAGMSGLTAVAISAFARADYAAIEPLLDEMFDCIKIKEPAIERTPTDDDIEEVATRIKLREEVLELHLGFFKAAISWIMAAADRRLNTKDVPVNI